MRHLHTQNRVLASQLLQRSCGLVSNTLRLRNCPSVSKPHSPLRTPRTALFSNTKSPGTRKLNPSAELKETRINVRGSIFSRVWNTWSAVRCLFVAALPFWGTHLLKNVHQQGYGLITINLSNEYKYSFAELMPGFWDLWSCGEWKRKRWGPHGRPPGGGGREGAGREQEAEVPVPGTLGPEWDSWAMGTLRTFPNKFNHHP